MSDDTRAEQTDDDAERARRVDRAKLAVAVTLIGAVVWFSVARLWYAFADTAYWTSRDYTTAVAIPAAGLAFVAFGLWGARVLWTGRGGGVWAISLWATILLIVVGSPLGGKALCC